MRVKVYHMFTGARRQEIEKIIACHNRHVRKRVRK